MKNNYVDKHLVCFNRKNNVSLHDVIYRPRQKSYMSKVHAADIEETWTTRINKYYNNTVTLI